MGYGKIPYRNANLVVSTVLGVSFWTSFWTQMEVLTGDGEEDREREGGGEREDGEGE